MMGRTVQTINHAMLPRATSSRPEKLLWRVIFRVGDHVLAHDFRPIQPGLPARLLDHLGVLYTKFNCSVKYGTDKNQLKCRQV